MNKGKIIGIILSLILLTVSSVGCTDSEGEEDESGYKVISKDYFIDFNSGYQKQCTAKVRIENLQSKTATFHISLVISCRHARDNTVNTYSGSGTLTVNGESESNGEFKFPCPNAYSSDDITASWTIIMGGAEVGR